MNEKNDDDNEDDNDNNNDNDNNKKTSVEPTLFLNYPFWAIYPVAPSKPCLGNIRYQLSNCIDELITHGKVVKVHDGHSIIVSTKILHEDLQYRVYIRLRDIVSPKFKSRNEGERELAWISRNALYDLIQGKEVELKNIYAEKYGRLYADVYYGNIHVNQWMVLHKYAMPYNG